MDHLNYHHLHVFWSVAREGSATAAARAMGLAQPTVSAQVRQLERELGEQLVERVGRRLELTAAGRLVRAYCDDIFGLGSEMVHALGGTGSGRRQALRVGVGEEVPKPLAWRVLQPVLGGDPPLRLITRQDRNERLIAELRIHELDVVIAGESAATGGRVRLHSELIEESPIVIVAPRGQVTRYRRGFPASLDGAPFLFPAAKTALRRVLDGWFAERGLHPTVVGEFEDPALLKTCASGGLGLCAIPASIEDEVRKHFNLQRVGSAAELREQVYVISSDRQAGQRLLGRMHAGPERGSRCSR